MKGENRTELEQILMDKEPVWIYVGPNPDSSQGLLLEADWGKFGEIDTNPYHKIAKAWMGTVKGSQV